MSILAGVHPVREALRAGRPIDRLLIAKGAGGAKLQEIIELAKAQKVRVRFEPRDALDRAATGTPHQGVIAFPAAQPYQEPKSIDTAKCVLVLDGVEDPHNLGAIIRTAHAAGVDAVMIPDRRAAGLTETVAKASAGAIEYVPVVRIGNVRMELERLKAKGFWIYGLDERAETRYDQAEFTYPLAIVLGGEGKGLHEHVRRQCDCLVRIPMAGAIASLNVSVAAGVILFELRRRRDSLTGQKELQK